MNLRNNKIIVIDDEVNILRSISSCLTTEGYSVDTYSDPIKALGGLRESFHDVAIIDIRLKELSGIDLYRQIKQEKIDIPVIFISSHASLDEAAETIKIGAYDFIEKPFSTDKLLVSIRNCLEFHRVSERLNEIENLGSTESFIGDHKSVIKLRKEIVKVAKTDSAVLILGESGTGKELIAKAIYEDSSRSENRFVKVNCSAIPKDLLESAMFGHVKGAFTGADRCKKGYFELADRGTIFLDEIADLPLASQASLLRVLENREIQKVGSEEITKVDVRVLAASHKNLLEEVQQGQFREDLFYRINVVPINLPPLKKRISDIQLLVEYFISSICEKNGFSRKKIEQDCYSILIKYSWPGNVRELRNIVERMVIMSDQVIGVADIPSNIALDDNTLSDGEDYTLKKYREVLEREYIIKQIKKYNGNITEVAKALGVDRTHLHKKMTQYGLKRDSFYQ